MNKLQIGIDIEKVSRFKKNKSDKFLRFIFTENEITYAFSKSKPELSLCGFFCVKEALLKTLEKQDVLLNKIEVIYDKKGRPLVHLSNKKIYKYFKFEVSIAHCEDYAVATVIRYKNESRL